MRHLNTFLKDRKDSFRKIPIFLNIYSIWKLTFLPTSLLKEPIFLDFPSKSVFTTVLKLNEHSVISDKKEVLLTSSIYSFFEEFFHASNTSTPENVQGGVQSG